MSGYVEVTALDGSRYTMPPDLGYTVTRYVPQSEWRWALSGRLLTEAELDCYRGPRANRRRVAHMLRRGRIIKTFQGYTREEP